MQRIDCTYTLSSKPDSIFDYQKAKKIDFPTSPSPLSLEGELQFNNKKFNLYKDEEISTILSNYALLVELESFGYIKL